MTVNTLAIASKALINDTTTPSAPSSFNATATAQFFKLSDLKNAPPSKAPHHSSPLPEPFHALAEHAILASAPEAFDPMEVAFHALGQQYLSQTEHLHLDWQLIKTYPLSSSLRAMSHVWKHSHAEGAYTISAKGAPEAVMSLCHFTAEQIQQWSLVVNEMASQGLRVLAVAKGSYPSSQWPEQEHDFDFKWLGLMGLSDPIRPEIAQAMQDCQTAGIKVLMITGDYPATAKVIAQQAGMPNGDVLSGDELDALSDEQLVLRLKTSNVCARISPHQKLRIVQVLKASGEVVAMTGDGVNDAPALKAAHVGVAMGARGTDVAREAASLVLVDDNFASIVKGIRLGRRIFKNLQKAMTYIFAIHIPIATIAFLPMLFGVAPILLPLHIALLELIIDPACSLAFENEPEDPAIMQTPPRNPLVAILASSNIVYAFLQGLMAVVGVGLAYYLATSANFATFATSTFGLNWTRVATDASTPQSIRTMVLIALITTHSLLIWINRAEGRPLFLSRHSPIKNKVALWITAGAWLILLAGIYLPFLARPLALSPLPWPQLASAIACGCVSLLGLLVLRNFKK
jgi:Ca2+-transporting ATPase